MAPDSVRLAIESKTFTINAQRTPETTALIVRALMAYRSELVTWLGNNEDTEGKVVGWMGKYDEWRAVVTTLKALGVELP